ncbi:MAG: sulfite exporter TauE/SafE family protein [Desulfobulbaceae bacterium]|nr:sulfite exporter TauE/SafE family protein [Desulfobulbaceae bacterium]
MKRFIVAIIVSLFMLPLATTALAGGGAGPPTDMLKGKFIEMNAAERTVVLQKDATEELQTLTLGAAMQPEDIRLNKKVLVSLDKHAGEGVIKEVSIMFMDMTPNKMISLLIVGLVGGLLSGFIGSGGAFVLTPAMMSLGAPGAVAVASNMCHKFPKAMIGTYKRWKYGQVDIKLALTMACTAIIGVQIGVQIQKYILNHWGNAGSNLYVSVVFVIILILVGGYVSYDARKLAKGGSATGNETPKLAQKMQKINLPPMMNFKVAKVRISAWVTIPVGLATGMLAATIAVGGFIGVPGMIYVIGASAVVASATELGIAFCMGAWGSIQWGLSGLIDIRLTLLILATSLIGVQLGALGTTYVKDYMIKVVMAATMMIVSISRGSKIPGYLADLGLRSPLDPQTANILNQVSFWSLVAALGTAGLIITVAMVKGISADRKSKRAEEALMHG